VLVHASAPGCEAHIRRTLNVAQSAFCSKAVNGRVAGRDVVVQAQRLEGSYRSSPPPQLGSRSGVPDRALCRCVTLLGGVKFFCRPALSQPECARLLGARGEFADRLPVQCAVPAKQKNELLTRAQGPHGLP